MTDYEIANVLRAYASSKNRAKELKGEMLRIAVEELGMDQAETINMNIETFLDGYLVGRGMMQSWRNIA